MNPRMRAADIAAVAAETPPGCEPPSLTDPLNRTSPILKRMGDVHSPARRHQVGASYPRHHWMRSSAGTRRPRPEGVILSSPISLEMSNKRAISRRVLMGAVAQRWATSSPGSIRPRSALGVASCFSRFSRRSISVRMAGSDRAASATLSVPAATA